MTWGHDDTTRLLCAWAEARAPFSRVFLRFQELSVGAESERREVTVNHRFNCMKNAHTVIAVYNKVASDREFEDDRPAVESPWFRLTTVERQRIYMATTPARYHFMDLLPEHVDAIAELKKATHAKMESSASQTSTVAASDSDLCKRIEAEGALDAVSKDTHNGRGYVWAESNTAKLIHVWQAVASKALHRKGTDAKVAREFKQILDHPPSTQTILRKLNALSTMLEVIQLHDANVEAKVDKTCSLCGQSSSWFKMSVVQRQHCFARASKSKYSRYLDLTSEQYAAVRRIKRSEFGVSSESLSAGHGDGGGASHKSTSDETKSPALSSSGDQLVANAPADEPGRNGAADNGSSADGGGGVAADRGNDTTGVPVGGDVEAAEAEGSASQAVGGGRRRSKHNDSISRVMAILKELRCGADTAGVGDSTEHAASDARHRSEHVDSGSRLQAILEKVRARVNVPTERSSTCSTDQDQLIHANEDRDDHDASGTVVESTSTDHLISPKDSTTNDIPQRPLSPSESDYEHARDDVDDGSSTESEVGEGYEEAEDDGDNEDYEERSDLADCSGIMHRSSANSNGVCATDVIDRAADCDTVGAAVSTITVGTTPRANTSAPAASSSVLGHQSTATVKISHSARTGSPRQELVPPSQAKQHHHQQRIERRHEQQQNTDLPHEYKPQDQSQHSQQDSQRRSPQSKRKRIESLDERSPDIRAHPPSKRRRERGQSQLIDLVMALQAQTRVLEATLQQTQQLVARQQTDNEKILRSLEQHQRACEAQREVDRQERHKERAQDRAERLELLEQLRRCQCQCSLRE